MGKISAFSHENIYSYNSDNNYLLLNFAISVYVFYNKNRFINLKKATRNQKLLYNTNIITIED